MGPSILSNAGAAVSSEVGMAKASARDGASI
jgi:hypothetical protein